MRKTDFLVVGAGIAGLLCATVLKRAGKQALVVDKGRGFGGRMATRRMSGGQIDHGAQFFTVRSPEFGGFVEEWLNSGVIREWFRTAPWDRDPEGHPRYCGINGMTDVPKFLAGNLMVERSVRLTKLRWSEEDGWLARSDGGSSYGATNLILSAPVPQSLNLLEHSGAPIPKEDLKRMEEIDYEPSLAGLFVLDGPAGLPDPGGRKLDEGPLAWVGDNTRKGISPEQFTVTAHSTEKFAREHWNSDDDVRLPMMKAAASALLDSEIVEAAVHRWRYNVPINAWTKGDGYYWNNECSLGLAGDGFGGPKVEGSALSGIRLARSLV